MKDEIGEFGVQSWRDGSGLCACLASMKMGIHVHRVFIKCEQASQLPTNPVLTRQIQWVHGAGWPAKVAGIGILWVLQILINNQS